MRINQGQAGAKSEELISGAPRAKLLQELAESLAAWETSRTLYLPFAETLLREIEGAIVGGEATNSSRYR
jgi:hypothetical protein